MALSKTKKQELVASYESALKASLSAVYVEFKKLPVVQTELLRKQLFAQGLGYAVVKKTLWSRATSSMGIKGDAPAIKAEMAVVYGSDLLSPARIANDFAKTHKATFSIQGGIFDGEFKSAKEMLAIATIPPREVLLSQIAYLLKSPMQRIAIAVSEVAKTK